MANWCCNCIAIYATSDKGESELKKLYMKIKGIGTECHSVPKEAMEYEETRKDSDGKEKKIIEKVESDWYGMLLLAHGLRIEDISDARGSLLNVPTWSKTPQNHIYLQTETAWDPKEHIIDEMISIYDDLAYVYVAEETGMEIFINTDEVGTFFPERYYIEWDICGWGGDSERPCSLTELIDVMREIVENLISECPNYESDLLKKIKEGEKITEEDVFKERDNIDDFLNDPENPDEPAYVYEYFGIKKYETC